MNEMTEALTHAVTDACARHPAPSDSADQAWWNAPLWSALEQIGITLLSISDEHGGSDGDVALAAAVLEVLGEHSAGVPLAETALQAGWLLAECRAPIPRGPMAAAVGGNRIDLTEEATGWVLRGEVTRVPWARHAEHLVLLIGRQVVLIRSDQIEVRFGVNLAGEARDAVILDDVVIPSDRVFNLADHSPVTPELFVARGAVGRLALTAGAARRALALSIAYASERRQFGRSLDKFQAVQQQTAALAGEVLLCKIAAESAALTLDSGSPSKFAVGAAKVSSGQAAGTIARIAHQIHGAIGVTEEHELRHSTTRLWSWRDEFGTVEEWARTLGETTETAGADRLWPLLADGKSDTHELSAALDETAV